ncbi:restriction endonuclease subunit M [Lysinibacillus sp. RSDA_15]|uniref:restriction endonuclease subunit M n=1 Tax=Lysinibacillus sp. RSDA_15 TaxID=3391421 RepID=UPI003A4E15DF
MDWIKLITNKIKKSKLNVVKINEDESKITYSNEISQPNRKIEALKGEEYVRAHLVDHLVNVLDYDPKYIELEVEYQYKNMGRGKGKSGRIDVIVRERKNNNPFFFIEVKTPEKYEHDKKFIEGQLFNLAEEEQKLNGTEVQYLVYYTIDYDDDNIYEKALIIDYKEYNSYKKWKEANYPSVSVKLSPGYGEPKKPLLIKDDAENDLRSNITHEQIIGLSQNLHNVLWGGGGTSDTEIFYSLVNIILAKIQDESEKQSGEKYDFQILKYGSNKEPAEKVFERVNELYRRALEQKLNIKDKRQLEKAYVINEEKFSLNKLVYAVEQFENYSFMKGRNSSNDRDILGDFFEKITRAGFKQTQGQFFTPTNIIKFIIYAMEIDKLSLEKLNNDLELPYIIDPSCGSGTFLIEVMKLITKELKYKQREKISTADQVQDEFDNLFLPDRKENKWAKEYLYGIEINFDLGIAAKVNMILHGDGATNIFANKDGLLPFKYYDNKLAIHDRDKLYDNKEVNAQFDIVLSNPPFSVDLDTDTKNYLNRGFMYGDKKNSENLFIERYYQLLKEKGRLGVVLPESVFDTTENKYIRLFLYKYFNVKAIISLPQLTFEPHTSTKTSILFAQKKTASEVEKWNKDWSMYEREWSNLKTRVENYVKVYVNGNDIEKYPSIKEHDENESKKNIFRYLKEHVSDLDRELSIVDLLNKYEQEILDTGNFEADLGDDFGKCNIWWVFGEVSKSLDYDIFMGAIDNVGYKRPKKRPERKMPNDLYDIEKAPKSINLNDILAPYNKLLKELEAEHSEMSSKKDSLETRLKKSNLPSTQKQLNNLEIKIYDVEEKIIVVKEKIDVIEDVITQFYDESGFLKEEYYDRTEPLLLANFNDDGLLNQYKSEDVLLRKEEQIKMLDYFREKVKWD